MLSRLRDLRNRFDFFARSHFPFSRYLSSQTPIPPNEIRFQEEIRQFLEGVPWESYLFERKQIWKVADVGAKNFSLAPLIDSVFLEKKLKVEIHGIEIDAYRRFTNFHTRADYGNFFAGKARSAEYHAMDFLEFTQPLDLILMLHPFVTQEPLQLWGLPLKHFRPVALFDHAYSLLKKQKGFLILSSPTEQEFQIASELAHKSGFTLGASIFWKPQGNSVQKKPRYGRLCYSTVENVSDSGKRGIV